MKGRCHNDAVVVISTPEFVAQEVVGGYLRLKRERIRPMKNWRERGRNVLRPLRRTTRARTLAMTTH